MDIFTLENLIALAMLILLQAVLGFDNLLYITLESKRVEGAEKQAMVRRWGIGIAVVLRIVLLFVIMKMVQFFQDPVGSLDFEGIITGTFNFHSIIVLLGGVFIIWTAVKEIFHMISVDDLVHEEKGGQRTVFSALFLIVSMNLVFSFDSILSAMALSDVFAVMAIAIVIGGILMIWLSDRVAVFLEKNRMYEVLGLFILFIVGIMLISEGGHLAHLKLFGNEITPMSKATFYFVILILVAVDLVQSRYQRKLFGKKA